MMVDILRKYPVSATDGADALRQLADGLRLDATLADCNGSSYIEMKFMITPASARAVASEIARLQRQDAPAVDLPQVAEPAAWHQDLVRLQVFALALFLVLVLPVGLSILGVLQ